MISPWAHRRTVLFFVVLAVFSGKAWAQAPSITKLSVTQGDVGTSVTITGTNFGSSGTVTFNGATATPTTYTASFIVVQVQTNASTGADVVTDTICGLPYPSNGMWFTVTWSAPTISLSPNNGPGGTAVTISGNNFGPTQQSSTLTFNGVAAVINTWSSTSITTTVPSGATTGGVIVTVNGQASAPSTFTVNLPVPNITAIAPTGAPVGTSVTINGTNFGTGTSSTVTFNGTASTPTNWTSTAIKVPVPSASSGNVVVTVSGEASNNMYFTVLPATAPEITGFSVPSAITGTSITIQGSNFGTTGTVTFNGVTAAPTTWTSTSIQVPVPGAAATGPVIVTVNSVASNPTTFTVLPQISSISPTSGSASSVVQINGTGFGAAIGTSTVTLSGQPCVPSSWSDTAVITELPTSDAITGPLVVTVGGAASNGVTFTVQFNGTITGTVTNAANGTGISGASVKAYTGGALVSSATTSTTGIYTISNITNGTYTAVISATGFPPQTIDNIPVQLGGTATVNASMGAPSITTLSPSSGPVGTVVTITGTSFGPLQVTGSNVTFNGLTAKITTWSNTSIVATVPNTATTGSVIVKVGGVSSAGVTFTVGTATISGTVTAAAGGAAINGASVKALLAGVVIGSATSSSTGAYSITGLAPGSYDVEATATSFGDLISKGNVVTANNTTTVNLALPVPGTIAGTISNGTTGISGATVSAYQGYDAAGTATTNTSGAYSIAGLGPGTYTVTVSAAGYNTQNVNGVVVTAGNNTTEKITLPSQPVITYQYDAAGRLVAVVNSNGNTAAYNYDAAGNISSIAQNVATKVTITDFIPNNGPIGTTVTIYGTGFSTTASQNTVKFNGTTATVTSSTNTQIVTKVPTGATTGTISVTSPGGSAVSTSSFTVTTTNGLPTVTSFSPTIGVPATPVTVTGTNYNTTPANDAAQFNGASSPVTAATSTTLSTTVPVDATSGHITVSNGLGKATSTADFFVPPAPYTVASVAFTGRMTLGGTGTVTIGTANDIGLMLFDGTAGQAASFLLNNSTFSNFTTTIIAPGGRQLATANTGSSSLYIEIPGELPVTGTYTIMVLGASTGSVLVNSYVIPANVVKTISIGGAAVNVATTVPGQNIDLTFPGTVTQQATLYLSAITYTGCNSLLVTVLNPDNTTLATGADCNGTTLYVDIPALPQSGTFTIVIDPQGATIGGLTATLDNAATTKSTIAEGGSPVTLTIAQPGQQGNLSFSGKQGDRISLLMSSVTIPSSNVYIQNTAALKAGTKYTIEMDYFQNNGPSLAQLWYSSPSTPMQIIPSNQLSTPGGTAGALQGDYFTDTLLQGYPQVRRNDSGINFNWTNTSPDPSIPTTNFGIRWTGSVLAQYSENYTFCTLTDDGARLFINGQIVVNEWQGQSATQWCSNNLGSVGVGTGGAYIDVITLPATGTYNILLAPQNNGIGAMTFTLYKVPADVTSTISPNGTPATVTTTVPGQNASLTFSGTAGQRLSLLMSAVTIPNSNVAVENTATLTAGQKYPLQMQYYQGGGGGSAELLWYSNSTVKNPIPASQLYPSGSNTAGGLSASYYPNPLLEGAPQITRVDPVINFNYNSQGPDTTMTQQNFSANWLGSVEPLYSENYSFCTVTDDGSRLYLNSSLVVNDWQSQGATQYCSGLLGASTGVGTEAPSSMTLSCRSQEPTRFRS